MSAAISSFERYVAPAGAAAPAPGAATDALAEGLRVLASDSRLALLSLLRTPKTLDDILLAPSDARADARPDRAVSRQAVQRHLDVLLDAGLVRRSLARRGVARSAYEYVLDHTRVFALIEEMRQLTAYRSTLAADLVTTQAANAPANATWRPGPKLVIVHGVREGHVFDLDGHAPDGVWSLGRAEDADASVVYDPFVSYRNAEIRRSNGGYSLRDVPGSKNGTSVNWRPIPRGGEVPLRNGDIVGVGRTLLVFRDE